jgi:hypothetical protein
MDGVCNNRMSSGVNLASIDHRCCLWSRCSGVSGVPGVRCVWHTGSLSSRVLNSTNGPAPVRLMIQFRTSLFRILECSVVGVRYSFVMLYRHSVPIRNGGVVVVGGNEGVVVVGGNGGVVVVGGNGGVVVLGGIGGVVVVGGNGGVVVVGGNGGCCCCRW